MNEEKLYQIALLCTPGIGSTNIKSLISYCGSAKAVLQATKGKLAKIPGIGTITAQQITASKHDLSFAEKEIEKAESKNTKLHFYTDEDYPTRLKQVIDAPPLLYTSGNGTMESKKMVAIVGTRKATNYGKGMASELVEGLKAHNATIVSGLAYGIDITAHKAAIKHNLPTIGVMASGLDIIYPAAHKSIAKQMLNNGLLITENGFGTKPDAPRFPARNRIIAGMVDAIIVIEAARKGGALITAEIGNSYNKDVFAVPGSIGVSSSEGCNYLIKSNRAHLLEKIEDVEYIMNWDRTTQHHKPKIVIDKSLLSEPEAQIVTLLETNEREMVIDEISWKSQLTVSETATTLLQLEFKGMVQALPGKKFKLVL